MKIEKSCGAVVYRKTESDIRFLVIQHKNGRHWDFPKGHVEAEETERDTALREIKEETGLQVQLTTEFRTENQYSPKEGVLKDVIFFLAKTEDEKVVCQEGEVLEYQWLSFQDAMNQLTYESGRMILRKAYDFIQDHV